MAEVPKQLTPLKPKGDPYSDAVRSKIKGGITSKKQSYSLLVTNSKKARCKNCRLECPFRENNTNLNPDALCCVPSLRAEATWNKTAVAEWNDDKIKSFINELLNLYRKILLEDVKTEVDNEKKLKRETVRDLNTMCNRLIQFKEKYYPPVQKNINVNIDMTANKVIERIKQFKIVNEKKKKEDKDGKS